MDQMIAPRPSTDFDSRRLRDAFGHFATGVAIVTARAPDGEKLGITVNSLASLSLQPALLLWSIATSSRNHPLFAARQVRHFAVHVLGEDQQELCRRFSQRHGDRFMDVQASANGHGVPLLPGCLVRFECTTDRVLPGGDHSIVIGRIDRINEHPGEPLLFHRGRFGGFRDPA